MGDELEDELDGFGDFVSDSLHDTTLINDGNYSANFTTSKSISALKETADSILYVAQLIEKAEKEADAARNSSAAAVAQTRAAEAMDVVNQLEAAVSDWKDWNDDRQKKKIIVRTPKEILEIAAARAAAADAKLAVAEAGKASGDRCKIGGSCGGFYTLSYKSFIKKTCKCACKK